MSPFPTMFLLNQKIVFPFVHFYGIVSLFPAEWEEPKIGISRKGIVLLSFKNLRLGELIIVKQDNY